jgi:hypothetical protein
MKKWSFYIGMLLFSACASDELVVPDNLPTTRTGSHGVTFRISFADTESALTKAPLTAEDENRIDSLQIFIFRKGATADRLDDLYVERIGVPRDSFATAGPDKKVTVEITPSTEERRFVLVANSPEHTLQLQEGVTKVKDLIAGLTFSGSADYAHWKTPPSHGYRIPLWGETGLYTTFPSVVDVDMIRAVAGIEVGVDIHNAAGGDYAIGFGSIFTIDSVYLCNANDSGYIAPAAGTIASETSKVDIGYKFAGGIHRLMKKTIYAPAIDSLIISAGDTLHRPPFLILKARYYDGEYHYYRVDFTHGGAYKPLLRNHTYTVNITGIRTVGYATLAEAKEAPILPLNPKLVIGDEEATINEIVYLNAYWLGCQSTDVKADWNISNRGKIRVATSYPGGWKAEVVSENSPWLEGTHLYTTADHIHFDLDRNETGRPLTGRIKITAGTLEQYIQVTLSPGSHTYIAKKGEAFTFLLTSADIDGVNRYNRIRKIAYNYEDESPIPTNYATAPADFTIPSAYLSQEGIVFVTAYDQSDNLLWAWTVWVVDHAVDFTRQDYQRHYNGYTFMDRNLGASTPDNGGLYYQWGRKDPAADTTQAFVPPAVDLAVALEHPRNFYRSGTHPYDWMSHPNNNLWTTIEGEKGPYDPCPFGWRVPPAENNEASLWKGFTHGLNNMHIPAVGGISGETGLSIEIGRRSVWGASARGTEAYLYDAAGTHSKARRTHAYPVRCVRDVRRLSGSLILE